MAAKSEEKATLDKLKRKPNRRKDVPSSDSPREELIRLVKQHRALTKSAVAIVNMTKDKRFHETGEVIVNNLPQDVKDVFIAAAGSAKKDASKLEAAMTAQLKQIPIYTTFLKNVYGLGPVVCAYLCATLDIHKAVKPSAIKRYCGFAVINGRLERPGKSEDWKPREWCQARKLKPKEKRVTEDDQEMWLVKVPLGYNAEMRTRIFQAFAAMWKNSAKKTATAPYGSTTKYVDVWRNVKHRDLSAGKRKCEAHSKGWHKAADVLLEDLYIVWRAIEGLPVWPSYYASKLGYLHGGKICVNEPRMLTVEEALEVVGYVGSTPLQFQPEDDGDDLPDAAE